MPKYLIYDNACHLDEFLRNANVIDKSERGAKINDFEFVIDRLHIKNHTRAICHTNYNPNLYDELFKINTVVCEETNYWLSGFKFIMKHMNADRFSFFLFIILEIYNNEKLVLNTLKNR